MRLALIGCMVMNREINYLIAKSPHIIRAWWLRQGLHNTPDILRAEVQRTVEEIERENDRLPESKRFDGILLAYGLCSNGIIGLRSQTLSLIAPRCDDCIALFLGSAERYRELFDALPGVYWYNGGWIEQAETPSRATNDLKRAKYAAEYGEENADYLMECTGTWMANYRHCAYITSPLGDDPAHVAYTRQAAEDFGWEFHSVPGDLSYLEALLGGSWSEEQFLICPPGCEIIPDFSLRKISFRRCGTEA